jgi:hypothetical protein
MTDMNEKQLLAIMSLVGNTLEKLEILFGSLEVKENYPKIKSEFPYQIPDEEFNALVDWYLSCFTDEERAERKRLCALIPVGILRGYSPVSLDKKESESE